MNDFQAALAPRSDQINASDLIAGDMTITIEAVKVTPGQEQPVSMNFAGSGKVFRPCKSMCRVMVAAWGPDAKAYVGRSLTLYRDPKVKWGGMEVGGIRISHMSHIEREMVMALTMTKKERAPYRVKPLAVERPAAADRATLAAKALVERMQTARTVEDLEALTVDPKVIEQRKWLAAKRPALAAEVDTAVAAALARLDAPPHDGFPGGDE